MINLWWHARASGRLSSSSSKQPCITSRYSGGGFFLSWSTCICLLRFSVTINHSHVSLFICKGSLPIPHLLGHCAKAVDIGLAIVKPWSDHFWGNVKSFLHCFCSHLGFSRNTDISDPDIIFMWQLWDNAYNKRQKYKTLLDLLESYICFSFLLSLRWFSLKCSINVSAELVNVWPIFYLMPLWNMIKFGLF